jgi:hypothetical protein
MPIFVSRFSSARSGLGNFQALRVSQGEDRLSRRSSSDQGSAREAEDEGNQTSASGGSTTAAVRLLITTQRADQLAQRVTGQTSASRSTPANASRTSRSSSASVRLSTNGSTGPAAGSASEEEGRTATQTSPQVRQPAAIQNPQQARQAAQTQTRAAQGDVAPRVTLRPALQSAVRRIDNLTRLLSARRQGQVEDAEATGQSGRARLATSLRIEGTTAQTDIVRTAQNVVTSRTSRSVQEQAAQESRAEDRLKETEALKQNLREDVATVTRGLVKDTIRQNARNASAMAQNMFQAAQQQIRRQSSAPTLSLSTRPSIPSVTGKTKRQTMTSPNLAGLRSALALLGTNVNILIG